MEKMEITITRDNFTKDSNFSQEELLRIFLAGEQGWDWHYNITRDVWGYGDDPYDWENCGDEYIDSCQIQSMATTGLCPVVLRIDYEEVEA